MAQIKGTTITNTTDRPRDSMNDNRDRFENTRMLIKNGDIKLSEYADAMGCTVDKLLEDMGKSQLEYEMEPYLKRDRTDELDSAVYHAYPTGEGEVKEFAGAKLTGLKNGKVKCESDYLGNFEYDPKEFSIKTLKIKEDDGTYSELPVFLYEGMNDAYSSEGDHLFQFGDIGFGPDKCEVLDSAYFRTMRRVNIPEGIKVLDYTFANRDDLTIVPVIPNSVKSMHCTFENCKNIKLASDFTEGECNNLLLGGISLNTVLGSNESILLPDGLVDMSGAFKNCEHIKGIFERNSDALDKTLNRLPESIVNITEAWRGCESMDGHTSDGKDVPVYALPEFGGDITPYLCKELAKDANVGVTDDGAIPGLTKNHFSEQIERCGVSGGYVNGTYDETMRKLEQNAESAEKLEKTKMYSYVQSHDQTVKEDVEYASNGALTANKIGPDKYDLTGERIAERAIPAKEFELHRFAAAAIGAGLAFGLTSKISGKKTIGLLGGAAACYLLYRNMDSIAAFTAKHLPDGKVKDFVQKFSDSLYENKIKDTVNSNAAIAEYNDQFFDLHNVALVRSADRFEDVFKRATELSRYSTNIDELMSGNAEFSRDHLVFVAVATEGESFAKPASDAVRVSLDAIEDHWSTSSDNKTSDELNTQMRDYYITLLKGIESYSETGYKSMNQIAANSTSVSNQLNNMGVRMVNRATVSEIMQSLKDMDAQYSFMDDATWSEIQKLNIQGVDMGNIRNYDSDYMAQNAVDDESKRVDLINKFEEEKKAGKFRVDQVANDATAKQQIQRGDEFFDLSTNSVEQEDEAAGLSV